MPSHDRLFLDIGGVLLTDGWDHHARKRAATNFKLECGRDGGSASPDLRHLRGGQTHAGGIPEPDGLLREATVHAGSVSGIHVRAIATLSRDDRAGRAAQGTARAEDRRGQQRSARTECVSDSNVQAGSSLSISLFPPALSHLRKPDADIFRLALDIAQTPAEQVVYIENTPMFVQIAEGLGIRSILHTDYRSTCAKLASFGLQNDEGVVHETS